MTAAERLPFDETDAITAQAYLASIGRVSFDPFATDTRESDMILTTSLADARVMMAESFATRNAGGARFRVVPLFVESAAANAFAIDHAGLHVCGVTIGLVTSVYELGLFVFSQSALFRDIGEAGRERSPGLPAGAALAFWISDRLRAGEDPRDRAVGADLAPSDGRRQMAALFLTLLMLRFVWLHELFHCLNGHAGLRAREGRTAALHEMSDGDMLALVEIEQRAPRPPTVGDGIVMELDADRTAFWAMMKRQLDGAEPIDGVRALPLMMRLRLTAFAAVLMTFLFDQAARRRKTATPGTHPVPYHRLHNLVRTWASTTSDPAGTMKQVFALTIVEMDQFQACVPQAVSGAQLIQDLRSAELQKAFDDVEGALVAARLRFAPWAFRFHSCSPAAGGLHL